MPGTSENAYWEALMTPNTLALLLILGAIGGYALLCWIAPFGPCRACDGTGNHTPWGERRALRNGTPIKRRPRIRKPCRRCKGTGARLRIGRRIHNAGRRLHHDGTR
jgi:hypothetical protein